ncbi:hypothetical protein Desdi_0101 [Desulfitobacterium dichloroeliminans LMG P-21439]|uniref:Uncharacterized protein n=1 Tax=Desulfitobacterium dichloroeliminans (strain LMG P-21439 / DCA1) TaxID=871963 RepID=L0F1E8_DESDL|nr:hypothetical protein Desdi_0101 [Desulfitobacterium dichloroeliminans LMG P-21439]
MIVAILRPVTHTPAVWILLSQVGGAFSIIFPQRESSAG